LIGASLPASWPDMLTVHDHPLLELQYFVAHFPAGLPDSPDWLVALLQPDAPTPYSSDDDVRVAVRDLLRQAGFKPTGRSKPASEYLIRAAADGFLQPINALVDACNAVSLHTGLPVSVIDLGLVQPPLSVAVAPADSSYVFNLSGQVIDVAKLLCLSDAQGPCAGPVKDSQRTKTSSATTDALVVVWGSRDLPGRAAAAAAWYRDLLERVGATTRG
jgi:DNA/RNA-binding domain of Phe-tRNA-synthetase-like protein